MTAPVYAKKVHYNGNGFFTGEDAKLFLSFQKDFFSNISLNTLQEIIYRGPSNLKTNKFLLYHNFDMLKLFIENMTIDDSLYSGIEAMCSSKLVVIDYLGSGYLEALVNNVPTILFLHKNCYLSQSQEKIFDELIEVGIMQTDAKKASEFLEEIKSDPLQWWLKDNVQNAKNNFIDNVLGDGEILKDKLLSLVK